jgi:CubicO group peptidase (beta-lactamase class C family)
MRFLASVALLAFAGLTHAQKTSDVDQAVLQHLERTKTPGCSIAIVKDGAVVLSKGYGLANVETDAPATSETVYRIGSLTKPFTAALVMAHVEKGTVKLDDPMRKHLPDLPDAFEKVTVRQLLNHTSGIPSYTDLLSFVSVMRNVGSARAIIDMSVKEKANFAPGEGWKYNNTGYTVLGELVAKLEGKPWEAVVRERISTPLGLTHTQASNPAQIVKNRAAGYVPAKDGVANAPYMDMSWPGSAGVLESTVGDLVKFDAGYVGKLVKPETMKMMTTTSPVSKNYGLGWSLGELSGVPVVAHGGAIPGFNAFIGRVPSKKVTVIVLTNSGAGDASTLGRRLIGLTLPDLAAKPAATKDDDPATTAFAKEKFERLLKGELTAEELTPEFAKVMTPQLIEDIRKTLGALGPLTKFEFIESKKVGDVTARSYLIDLGGNALTATVTLTPDKKIAGITVKA